jgi:hypothetical protein
MFLLNRYEQAQVPAIHTTPTTGNNNEACLMLLCVQDRLTKQFVWDVHGFSILEPVGGTGLLTPVSAL